MKTRSIQESGIRTIKLEAGSISQLLPFINDQFVKAVETIAASEGRVVVSGIGKSAIVGQKIVATLNSTGTPAIFMHAADAIHGDMGIIQPEDVVVALSYSGQTDELLRLLEAIKRLGAKLIAITGDPKSSLAQAADVALDCGVAKEACPMNLVPTASTTAALALGDALAMTLLVEKGFRQEDFANLHPGGRLGKTLMRVESLMHTGAECPVVRTTTPMPEVIAEMSRKTFGMTCVVDASGALVGVITDGDLRRQIEKGVDVRGLAAADVMTRGPVSVPRAALAAQALNIMETRHITSLIVVDGESNHVAGVVHLHDLWRTEMI